MRYLWILLIPVMAFAALRGDRDPLRTFTGDRVSDDRDQSTQASEEIPSGGVARSAALSRMVPWRQIEQWKIFDEFSNSKIFRLLDARGLPPDKEEGVDPGGFSSAAEMDRIQAEGGRPRGAYSSRRVGHFGWGRFFSLIYHGPKSAVVLRFSAIPDRKVSFSWYSGQERSTIKENKVYTEDCRTWLSRLRKYWARYHRGETAPQPCTPEPSPEKRRQRRDVVPGPEPFKPPPVTTTEGALKAPVIDQGTRTTYQASDGRPIQGQNNPGHHRTSGSATLSSGQVIIDLNTSVGAGRNDMSFIDLNYVGHARSTDTGNTNTYTVYALSKNKILIKSSSGTDTATVNFTVEGQ